ncbi:MAG TPA: FAD-binding and (Fe-S)-binding domain-containing protein [Acidimicrobiales bacterium]|nr:FAD-binding and (Fe-S)-binding domain-containing protein [Acidimicrobiales bacterium]
MAVDAHLAALLREVVGDAADDSPRRLAEYSSDASNYRVVPSVVVFPRHVDDILAVAEVCRREGVALTARGGGTSCAGNAVGPGVVLDLSRHLGRVLAVDPDTRTARVEPGAVLDTLQAAAGRHGLRFGPDPSSHSRCTLGGMIGNNACGAHAMAYGTTAANVAALDLLDGRGRRLAVGPGGDAPPGLAGFVTRHVEPIAGELGRFGRQVSGYSLEHLLGRSRPGDGLAAALVGTEGTCGIVLGAELRLVPLPAATALVVAGYPDMPAAAGAVPGLLPLAPLALEGIDVRLVDLVRARRPAGLPELPAGAAWLMAEVGGETPAAALAAGEALLAAAGALDGRVVPAGPQATALWRIREDGAGLGSRTPAGAPAWPAWEDAAVPPAVLAPYLRDFTALLADHGLDGLLYGHFGDGCIHVRIDLPLAEHPRRLRPFLVEAATLVAGYGGSLSGEHGDGRARSELLPLMYSPAAIEAFAAFKALFDPDHLLNPGVLVDPAPVDTDLRRPLAGPVRRRPGGLALHADGGDFTTAVHRCVGVGKCRADNGGGGGFMCPSFLATGDEKDSTRGRARVLQEMANGSLVADGWRSPEVHEALDLCLACRACARDCPVSVDMATYKAEVLHQTWKGRLRPRSHYSLGWLPLWLDLARRTGTARLAGRLLRLPAVAGAAKRLAGIDARRPLPAPAADPLTAAELRAAIGPARAAVGAPAGPVVLWADSFTRGFAPGIALAAARVLTEAGFEVVVPDADVCCGLTWVSTGQLDAARRRLRRAVDVLAPWATAGVPIVGLEPSCAATLRADLTELLPRDARAAAVAGAVRTLAQVLLGPGSGGAAVDPDRLARVAERYRPALAGRTVVAQPHCHHHAVFGYDADLALLRAAGAHVRALAGCCGLAGNFGMETGHYEVSAAVAAHALLPALEGAPAGAVLLADGFSCRTQAAQLGGRECRHLAELLAGTPAPDGR